MHLWFPEVLMLYQELDSFVLPMRKESESLCYFCGDQNPRTIDTEKSVYRLSEWGAKGDLKAGKCSPQILLEFKRLYHLKCISKRKTERSKKRNIMPVRRRHKNADYTLMHKKIQ